MYLKHFELKTKNISVCVNQVLTAGLGIHRFCLHKLHLDLCLIALNTFGFVSRDLAKKDRNGASDPFVRVRYNGKTYESTVRTCLCLFMI